MTTYVKDTKDGRVFLNGRLGPHCYCGWVNTILCDYPVGNERTCDRKLCEDCCVEIAPDTHYCSDHNREWEEFTASGKRDAALANVIAFKPPPKRPGS